MTCYLLHMIEAPDRRPYDDPELKDLIGQIPQLYCAQCTPPRPLRPSDSARCLAVEAPCWQQPAPPCPED